MSETSTFAGARELTSSIVHSNCVLLCWGVAGRWKRDGLDTKAIRNKGKKENRRHKTLPTNHRQMQTVRQVLLERIHNFWKAGPA